MRQLIIVILAVLTTFTASAAKYEYTFDKCPISTALLSLIKEHPDVKLSFIYQQLDDYTTSAHINTDDSYRALRQIIGLNPISILKRDDCFYIEALQKGKYTFTGQVIGTDGEPVPATVMMLTRQDSTVITYGVADVDGAFSIPCDYRKVITKVSSVGYHTAYISSTDFNIGTIVLELLPINLNAVTVEAQHATFNADKNTYLPTSHQKRASQTATDLLRRMAIPQLLMAPGSDAITDLFGNNVAIFINYQKATSKDLVAMRVTDVRKVEYYEYPSDARFQGCEKVVNFIMQEYEYGGYTKLSTANTVLNGLSSSFNIYSKFIYKKMTYDLYAGTAYNNNYHKGVDTYADFTICDGENTTTTINRTETITDSHQRFSEFPITFQATYNTTGFSTRNAISFSHNSTSCSKSSGRLTSDLRLDDNFEFERSTPGRNNNVEYFGNIWKRISKSAFINIAPSFVYTHRDDESNYKSSLSSPINYLTEEDAYNMNLQVSGQKSISDCHELSGIVSVSNLINEVQYRGNGDYDDSYNVIIGFAGVNYKYKGKHYILGTTLGGNVTRYDLNDVSHTEFNPNVRFQGRFTFNKKHQLGATVSYNNVTPDISMRSNSIVQSNELMYLTGNPNLDSYNKFITNIAYNWIPNNRIVTALFGGTNFDLDRMTTIYLPYNDGSAIIRGFVNDGNYLNAYVGASVNWRLFNNSLQLYTNLNHNYYHTTGIYNTTHNALRLQLQADYYWNDFSFTAYWSSPDKKLTENSNIMLSTCNFHGISAGWSNGMWNVKLQACNFFNNNWKSSTWKRLSPLYSERQYYYNPSAHANINLSITYIIGYGRKIKQSGEVGKTSSAQSAILE